MTLQKIIEFARKNGYDGAVPKGMWRDYKVYEPTFEGDKPMNVGLPLMILVKGEEIRLSTPDEAFAYLDTLPDEE